MHDHDGLFIGGSMRPSTAGAVVDVISPTTEERIGRVPRATTEDIDAAVAAARHAFDHTDWPTRPVGERLEVLAALSSAIKNHRDELADLLVAEMGTPRKWATFGQVGIATAVLDTYVSIGATHPWTQTRPSATGGQVRVRQVPLGVVGAIVPWNTPLFITALKLGPAFAAGCTVVLKPSTEAPLAMYRLVELAHEAGVPAGVLNLVPAGGGTSSHLVSHPGVDKISFTGSTGVGRDVAALCGNDLRRVTLELGGKSAGIVLDDADLDEATVDGLITGAMSNNGQICMSMTRILAPRSRYDEVVDALTERAERLVVGDPADRATEVGPLANERARDGVLAHLEQAVRDGAKATTGGGRPAGFDRGYYVAPTILRDVTNDMTVAREELFAPVIVVIAYEDDDDAVAIANDSEYGLAGSVWSADVARAESVASRIRTGSVAVNSSAPLDFGSPFGGFKNSGIGREGGPEAFEAYTEYQSIVLPV